MWLIDWLTLRRNRSPAESYDFDDLFSDFQQVYLKSLAIDKSAEFLARIFSKAEFHHKKNDEILQTRWSKLLNTKPNKNESASRFWQRVIYTLIVKNEVLIILTENDQLLIADSYVRVEDVLDGDHFESVSARNHQFPESFAIGDVIFIEYNNHQLNQYLNQLFDDYHKLYNRMVEAIARNNQIRGTLKMTSANQLTPEYTEKLKKYSEKLFRSFSDKSVAIVPMVDQIEYKELTNTTGVKNTSVEDLKRLRSQFEDEVASMVGIPPVLLHGEIANVEDAQKSFKSTCLRPLVKKLKDELNGKIITDSDFKSGYSIDVVKVIDVDLLELASSIDKITSSGAFKVNEVRKEVGYKPVPGGDVILRTKNYEETEVTKGKEETQEDGSN